MTVAYPDGLPLPLRDGYGLDKVNRIRTTAMDNGRAVQRWEFDDAPEFPSVSWIFSEPQSRLFNAWTNQVAKAGWFTVRLLTDMGFDDVTARFAETPKRAELVGKYLWRWTATLEIEFEQMMPPEWAELMPDYILYADIFDLAQNREKPATFGAYLPFASVIDFAANRDWPEDI